MSFQATVDVGTAGDTITNTVTKTQDQTDSDTTADDLSEPITVGNSTDLEVTKTVDNATPDEGATITYTIELSNNGPARAETIVVTDVVPAGLTYVPGSISGGDHSGPERSGHHRPDLDGHCPGQRRERFLEFPGHRRCRHRRRRRHQYGHKDAGSDR